MNITPAHRVFVAGHRGLAGSAVVRCLEKRGYARLLLRTRSELDLLDQAAVTRFFSTEKPEGVVFCAARVGGIGANSARGADFLYENLTLAANVIHAARLSGVGRFIFLGSSCIYPRACPQPMREEHLLTGPLESTNEPYAIAKIAGLKLIEACNRQYGTDFVSLMPTNLYGPNDNYDLAEAHVLPAMIRRFEDARLCGPVPVVLWGSGAPLREFLHADDLAEACALVLEQVGAGRFPGDVINVGSGEEVSIRELAALVQAAVGHRGEIRWDAAKPDGTPRKLLDSSRIRSLGWAPRIRLADGLRATVELLHRERGF